MTDVVARPVDEARAASLVRWSAALSALAVGLNLTVMNVAVADLRRSYPSARLTTTRVMPSPDCLRSRSTTSSAIQRESPVG